MPLTIVSRTAEIEPFQYAVDNYRHVPSIPFGIELRMENVKKI